MQTNIGVEPRDKCNHLLERWAKIIDHSRYVVYEHRFKEKEYGIKWRTAYKKELVRESNALREKFGAHLQDQSFSDMNEQIHLIVKKDWQDVYTFAQGLQIDLMLMLQENLDSYEISLGFLRNVLKNS